MTIKAIIFDLGGVIINIDYARTVQAFKSICGYDFDKIYSQYKQSTLFDDYETGKITDDFFRERLIDELDLPVSSEQFDQAWNAMLLDLPKERLDFISKLRAKGYQTYLFSNTNAIHLKRVFEISSQTIGVENFSSYFTKEYYSHTFGMRKPNPNAFKKILEHHQLKAQEVLFVDDSKQHIEGAKIAGLHTLLIDATNSIFDIPSFIDKLSAQIEHESDPPFYPLSL